MVDCLQNLNRHRTECNHACTVRGSTGTVVMRGDGHPVLATVGDELTLGYLPPIDSEYPCTVLS